MRGGRSGQRYENVELRVPVPLLDEANAAFDDLYELIEYVYEESDDYGLGGVPIRPQILSPDQVEYKEHDVVFTEIQETIIQGIRDAKYTIWAAVAWINNQAIIDELLAKKKQGVHVRLIISEIVANTRRLCLMNMFLHNIGEIDGESFISSADALIADEGNRYDYVLANPPFGKKSSMTITNEEGEQVKEDLVYNRQDFWVTTSNKQLNFLQHIRTLLKENGQAAVVLPDNVLFEGGAGETVRKELLKTTELHTILRLPTGIFYRPGVKANVLFFDNRPGARDPWTKEVWFYDYRTNIHHTLKKKPMQFEDLEDFIKCYNPSNRHDRWETWSEENPEGRWRKYSYDEIIERDKTSLDIFWLKDDSLTDLENLPDPDILANEIIENIEAGLESFQALMETLNGE